MEPIKRMADLTNKEIMAIKIGSDDYNNLIDLECAYAGFSLLPEHPGSEPPNLDMKPDSTLYKVGNWGFKTLKDADEVIDYMLNKGVYRDDTRAGISIIVPMEENSYYYPDVKKVPVYTEDTYEQIKTIVKQAALVKEEWKEKNREYQSAVKERQAIIKDFDDKVTYVREIENGVAAILKNLQRYLTLAQGSYQIAVTFLKEADKIHTIDVVDDEIYYICTKNDRHLVMTKKQYQKDCMSDLLGAKIDT